MTRVIASWFGSGLILRRLRGNDDGSGTVGAVFALIPAWVLGEVWGWQGQILGAAVVVAVSVIVARADVGDPDPGWIVIDEAAGTLVATVGLGGIAFAVAFIVFRVVDITKRPFPGVIQAERLPSGWGITFDDVVAGLYGLAVGHLIQATLL